MKFSPEYRDDWHRGNIDKATQHHMKMEVGYKEMPALGVIAKQMFDLSHNDSKERETILNLIAYISKRHSHQVTRGLKPAQYMQYVNTGETYYYTDDGKKMAFEESELSPSHELPHYLVSYLINSNQGVNNNNVFPSYLTDLQQKKIEIDNEGIGRQYLEEVYASAISCPQGESNLFIELTTLKFAKIPFNVAAMKIADNFLAKELSIQQEYSIDKTMLDKTRRDYELCKDRILEVITSSDEEREKLKATYPLECFFYDLCHAYYEERNRDPKAVWNVYQKHFKRLFEKANANPTVYTRKSK